MTGLGANYTNSNWVTGYYGGATACGTAFYLYCIQQ
jgi:hypothetical protein